MPTTTTWTQGNKLPRHKHLVSSPSGLIEQEHFASQLHRNDPDAHDREQSWSEPGWHMRSGIDDASTLTSAERIAMLQEACNIHDAALNNQTYTPSYAQPNAPTQALSPAGPISPTSPPQGQDPAPRVTDELLKRLDDVENIALLVMDQGTKAEQQANAASRLADASRMTAERAKEVVDIKVALLDGRIDDIAAKVEATRRVEYVITAASTGLTHTHVLPSRHKQFDTLLAFATALEPLDRNIWIAGPAGSGKTTAARQLSQVLNLPFDFNGAISMPYELLGYKDAAGTYHDTAFRRMYENGGVWLGDECDASSPAATLTLNAALANSHMSFPDKQVPRHTNFLALAAANTWGLGGDSNYVGRNKQDAAFLDRFVTLDWEYDEQLEAAAADVPLYENVRLPALVPIHVPATDTSYDTQHAAAAWVNTVQQVRRSVFEHKATMVISPRASIKGAQLLRARITPALVIQAIFGRYRTHSSWPTVGRAAEEFARHTPQRAALTDTTLSREVPNTNGASSRLQSVDFSNVRVFDSNRSRRSR